MSNDDMVNQFSISLARLLAGIALIIGTAAAEDIWRVEGAERIVAIPFGRDALWSGLVLVAAVNDAPTHTSLPSSLMSMWRALCF